MRQTDSERESTAVGLHQMRFLKSNSIWAYKTFQLSAGRISNVVARSHRTALKYRLAHYISQELSEAGWPTAITRVFTQVKIMPGDHQKSLSLSAPWNKSQEIDHTPVGGKHTVVTLLLLL